MNGIIMISFRFNSDNLKTSSPLGIEAMENSSMLLIVSEIHVEVEPDSNIIPLSVADKTAESICVILF